MRMIRLSWRCLAGAVVLGVIGALAGVPGGALLHPYASVVCGVIGGAAGALVGAAAFCGRETTRDGRTPSSSLRALLDSGFVGFLICLAAYGLIVTRSPAPDDPALTLWMLGIILQLIYAWPRLTTPTPREAAQVSPATTGRKRKKW
jgi:hypothetical protein